MMFVFPSKEWAKALCEELNKDEDFLKDPITALLSVFSKLEIRGSTVTLIRLAANVASPIARVMRKIPTKIIE